MIEVAGRTLPGGGGAGRMSLAFFCPSCGHVWSRIHRGTGWYSVARWCAACPPSPYHIGGSLFQDFEWQDHVSLVQFLSVNPEILAYEFEIHLAWAEGQFSAKPLGTLP